MRRLCVVLHDVAPARWGGCLRVLHAAGEVAAEAGRALPLTLLVVPRWHGDASTPPAYRRWLQRLHRLGHELALHGLTHRDDGAPPRGWRQTLLRRHYTAGEGEFAALGADEAAQRIAAGRAWAAAQALPVTGFVPPAWLASPAALDAVADAGFAYTATLTRLLALPARRALAAPALVFSTRSAWRRVLSLAWNRARARRHAAAPLLRLELHPDDADHPAVRRCWQRLLREALATRTAVRLADAVAAG